jgi:conjugal transfer pilus assembly protein TraW
MHVWAGLLKIVLLVALFVCFKAQARDLGVIGPHLPIIEEDLLVVIERRLQQQQDSGALAQKQAVLLEQAKAYARNPVGVDLPRADVYRIVPINPRYTLQQDILDEHGAVLFKAGTQVNPLAIQPLTRMICFIDGTDMTQVAWLKDNCMHTYRHKRILVQGDIQTLSSQLKTRLYFDQYGVLAGRLRLQALPATLRQQGMQLYVEEHPIH